MQVPEVRAFLAEKLLPIIEKSLKFKKRSLFTNVDIIAHNMEEDPVFLNKCLAVLERKMPHTITSRNNFVFTTLTDANHNIFFYVSCGSTAGSNRAVMLSHYLTLWINHREQWLL